MHRQEKDSIDELLVQWKRAGPPFDPITEGALGRIVRLGRYLTRLLSESAAAYDLSGEEWETLSVLKRVGASEEATPGRLAQDLNFTPGAATARLDRLERKGLVRRRPHATDRRTICVELTPAGERAWREAHAVQHHREQLIIDHLSAAERKQLNDLLRRLMLAFEESRK
jgi:DNA-binding MarR family transcriptional regulator